MCQTGPSRRAFLRSATAAAALAASNYGLLAAASPAAPAVYPDRFQRDGGLVILPDRGTLYVASDFHTRHADFQRWLTRTDIVSRLKNDPDTYGLILGDAADAKPGDTHAERDGDSRIIDRVREIQTSLGEAGRRLIFIQGNHEYEAITIYDVLKQKLDFSPRNRIAILSRLYAGKNGTFFQQFNFLERITDEQAAYLRDLPVAVLCKNGLVATHGAPARSAASLQPLIRKDPKIVDEIVWPRIKEVDEKGYSPDDLMAFLKLMENGTLLLSGHTPLGVLPPQFVHNGIGIYGDHQIILATSYGSEPGEKSYLVLDLKARYPSAESLSVGKQILRLSGKAGVPSPALPPQALALPRGWIGECTANAFG